MKKLLYILLFLTFSLFSQTESFDGKIIEVIWRSRNYPLLKVQRDDTGEILLIETRQYLRYQKKFTVQGDTLSILPPPLHITDMWDSEQIDSRERVLFVHTSEPTSVKLFMREHRWDNTNRVWYEQVVSSVKERHGIVIPNEFNLGLNWSWDWYVIITNESGDTFQSKIYTFKNKFVNERILRDNESKLKSMIPVEQRLEYYWNNSSNNDTLESVCKVYIKDGWVIHQIIQINSDYYYILLYKY